MFSILHIKCQRSYKVGVIYSKSLSGVHTYLLSTTYSRAFSISKTNISRYNSSRCTKFDYLSSSKELSLSDIISIIEEILK
jgi:hypothetical protein